MRKPTQIELNVKPRVATTEEQRVIQLIKLAMAIDNQTSLDVDFNYFTGEEGSEIAIQVGTNVFHVTPANEFEVEEYSQELIKILEEASKWR